MNNTEVDDVQSKVDDVQSKYNKLVADIATRPMLRLSELNGKYVCLYCYEPHSIWFGVKHAATCVYSNCLEQYLNAE